MSKVTKRKRELIASEIVLLDPLDCGSSIGYTVLQSPRYGVNGEIMMTDCNRKIEWYFSARDADPIAKIDHAINIMSRFRTEFIAALGKKRK